MVRNYHFYKKNEFGGGPICGSRLGAKHLNPNGIGGLQNLQNVLLNGTPVANDWNQDGLMDFVMLDHEGSITFFERFKKKNKLALKPGIRIFKSTNASSYKSRY